MPYITNKKAKFNYEIVDTYTAGIELFGYEVKSIRGGRGSLEGSHVVIRGNEAYLVEATIPAYQPNNAPATYAEARPRKLLLTKKEISAILNEEKRNGLTIVPLSMYNKGVKIKVDIATVRGKKKYDKRESIKKRDTEKDIGRKLKNR